MSGDRGSIAPEIIEEGPSKKVFVVGFVTNGGVGGFEWRDERAPAETIRTAWVANDDSDVSDVRVVEIPHEHTGTRAAIGDYLDSNAELWEPKPREGRRSRIEQVKAKTDELEGNAIMENVVVCILDREEDDVIDVEKIATFLNDYGTDDLYINFIGPAIDRCEQAIRETWKEGQ